MDLEIITDGGYLTKLEAIILLGKGKILSHHNFDKNEYMQEKDGKFLLSGQWEVSKRMFWADRNNKSWDFGWFEVKLHPDGFIEQNNREFFESVKELSVGDSFRAQYDSDFVEIKYFDNINCKDGGFIANKSFYNYEDVLEIKINGQHKRRITTA